MPSPRLTQWVYRAVLQRDCARRHPGALLMHMLGPATHWTHRLLPLVAVVVGAAFFMALLRVQASARTLEAIAGGSWLFASSALLVQLFDYQRRLMRLECTRGEQGLVRLAPNVPGDPGTFNRHFAGRLLCAGLLELVCVSAAVLAIVALTGGSAASLRMQASICCLTLPLIASTLRDHARSSGSGGWWLVAVSLALSFLAGAVVSRLLGMPVLPAAALASVVLTVVAVSWRRRRVATAPHAFPVGRLA